jgi:hypothetical protein
MSVSPLTATHDFVNAVFGADYGGFQRNHQGDCRIERIYQQPRRVGRLGHRAIGVVAFFAVEGLAEP